MTLSNFLIMGQYVHLPRHVQCVGIIFLLSIYGGGYEIDTVLSISLIFGSLLKPTIGFSGKVWE